MTADKFREFLMSMIFKSNEYGSTKALLTAIEEARAIDENCEWSKRKHAFNVIGDKAPMRDDTDICVVHADVPAFLKNWEDSYKAEKQIRRATNAKQAKS